MGNDCDSICDPIRSHEPKQFQVLKNNTLKLQKSRQRKESYNQTIIDQLRKFSYDSRAIECYSTHEGNNPSHNFESKVVGNHMKSVYSQFIPSDRNQPILHQSHCIYVQNHQPTHKYQAEQDLQKHLKLNAGVYLEIHNTNKQQRRGKQIINNRNSYEGNYMNGVRSGQGVLISLDGCSYTGQWKNNTMNGLGSYNWSDGTSYTGNWCDGQIQGQGVYCYRDQKIYKGQFVKGKKQGFGILIDGNKRRYQGNWENDLPNGQGVMYLHDGQKITGIWKNGELV